MIRFARISKPLTPPPSAVTTEGSNHCIKLNNCSVEPLANTPSGIMSGGVC